MTTDGRKLNIMLNYIYSKTKKIDIQATVLYIYLDRNDFIIDVSPKDFYKDATKATLEAVTRAWFKEDQDSAISDESIEAFLNQSKKAKCLKFSKPYGYALNTLSKLREIRGFIIHGSGGISKSKEEEVLGQLVKDITILDKKVRPGYLDKEDEEDMDYMYKNSKMNTYSQFKEIGF